MSTTVALGATIATLAAVTAVGTWYARGRVASVEDLVTARNSTGTGTTTATLIASSMGAWILFGPAEAGAAFGGLAAVAGYAAGSALALLAYVVVGPRIRSVLPDGHSLTQYVQLRYGRVMYAVVALVSVFYMFIFLAAEMTGIAGALALVAGVPTWQTATLIGTFVLAYTGYGGLRASIVTDAVQALVILPLLAVGFGGALLSLGGAGEVHGAVAAADADLLDPRFLPGLTFGAYVVIAILGAEMVNQAWWQRTYAARDAATLRRSFVVAAAVAVPMILLSGLFGLAASGLGLVDGPSDASVAFFVLVGEAFPEWVSLIVVLLAVLLVASTADTLFNAIAGLVTADLPLVLDDPDERTLRTAARAITIVVALGAVLVGSRAESVLTLFLTADLLAAATFVPLVAGLFSGRMGQIGAAASVLAGIAVGVAVFPPLRAPLAGVPGLDVLPEPDFLVAFAGAAGMSAVGTALSAALGDDACDLDRLSRKSRGAALATDGGDDA